MSAGVQQMKCLVKHIIYISHDWEHINDTCIVISDANNMQQIFSSKQHPTLWCAIPALKQLQTLWEKKWDMSYILATELPYKVLHPYYKLNYIKMAWGGQEEQVREFAAGN
ncbi:hypothetical protein BDR04DRAFT_1123701 [Suillus decipiens]|nr:hypothetical protein BDR04DRAFT_1123701 [Suillus decipiens]